jgi:hypothetical protein
MLGVRQIVVEDGVVPEATEPTIMPEKSLPLKLLRCQTDPPLNVTSQQALQNLLVNVGSLLQVRDLITLSSDVAAH